MSHLSGKLKTFSLRQILVLLADADTTGELQVASPTLSGRIFFESGVVAYGTTRAGEDSLSELDRLLESYDEDSPARARPVIKEQLTEVLHGLMQAKSGTFDFDEGTPGGTRSFDVGVTFTVTDLLAEVDNRIEEWRKIREVIPSTSTTSSSSHSVRQRLQTRWMGASMTPLANTPSVRPSRRSRTTTGPATRACSMAASIGPATSTGRVRPGWVSKSPTSRTNPEDMARIIRGTPAWRAGSVMGWPG